MMVKHAFYAQSGGVTAVINASACGVIEAARQSKKIGKVFAGKNGILGALQEALIDTSLLPKSMVAGLKYTPGGAFGSCRYKLKDIETHRSEYERILEVFSAHDIGYFFYNGGGDSQDTANKLASYSAEQGYPLICIGIPKTVDNDLPFTDCSPGFGSVAKYVATAVKETALDVASMAQSSTKVFILEVMGRHAGWIAAAGGLAAERVGDAPHIILFPEIAFDRTVFLKRVEVVIQKHGYCSIVVSEGVRDAKGVFLSDSGVRDAFGHAQLGGVAPVISGIIREALGLKCHWAVADYLQRAARHIASKTDVEQAYAVGRAAVEYAIAGMNAVMPIIVRKKTARYQWTIDVVSLSKVANQEKHLPKSFITKDGFGITAACRSYLAPLIMGEDYPPFQNGLPNYVVVPHKLVRKKCAAFMDRSKP